MGPRMQVPLVSGSTRNLKNLQKALRNIRIGRIMIFTCLIGWNMLCFLNVPKGTYNAENINPLLCIASPGVMTNYKPQQRREVLRVCEVCGFSCSNFRTLLQHTESLHPLAVDVIAQLRRRILRSLNWLPISFILFYICYNNKDLSFDSLNNTVFTFLFPNDFSKCFSRFFLIIKVHLMSVFMIAV